MGAKLKRDQIPHQKAENWKQSFLEETKHTFNLIVPKIVLQKETYKKLIGENENRVRIYLGLENEKDNGHFKLCAFAVSSFLMGSGDVYADYETPVFKLENNNVNVSDKLPAVIESIRLYRRWRMGELDPEHPGALYRQYIYPNAYLLTKYELHELFNVQNSKEVNIEFGIAKTMSAMLYPGTTVNQEEQLKTLQPGDEEPGPFDFTDPCPPFCDERSPFNPS